MARSGSAPIALLNPEFPAGAGPAGRRPGGRHPQRHRQRAGDRRGRGRVRRGSDEPSAWPGSARPARSLSRGTGAALPGGGQVGAALVDHLLCLFSGPVAGGFDRSAVRPRRPCRQRRGLRLRSSRSRGCCAPWASPASTIRAPSASAFPSGRRRRRWIGSSQFSPRPMPRPWKRAPTGDHARRPSILGRAAGLRRVRHRTGGPGLSAIGPGDADARDPGVDRRAVAGRSRGAALVRGIAPCAGPSHGAGRQDELVPGTAPHRRPRRGIVRRGGADGPRRAARGRAQHRHLPSLDQAGVGPHRCDPAAIPQPGSADRGAGDAGQVPEIAALRRDGDLPPGSRERTRRAQPGTGVGARIPDRDQRRAQGHQPVQLRYPAGVRDDRRDCDAALRRGFRDYL